MTHHRSRRCIQRQARQGHTAEHIIAGEDASQSAAFVGEQDRADLACMHQAQDLAQGGTGRLRHRFAHRQISQDGLLILLLLQLRLKFMPPALARRLQKSQHALIQEIGPDHTGVHQFTGHRPGDEQAETVFQGRVGAGHWPLCQQRRHRQQAARIQLKRIVRLGAPGAAAEQTPLAKKDQLRRQIG